ncbi:PucR-like helix-turn-helix protein [Mumia flava]|uniref:PucR-like helix-turn-helix protein n=1 Tax=Mumia flava TaxID=1348852 RepID=A0A0B2BPM7_9ACTN|nr:helix-turn-helix domain-containing protein [Mumia flava]PJJ57086.1 PucR-like helix-turn-helix protein [Mumia flava]
MGFDERTGVRRRLTERSEEVAARLIDAVRAEIPTYAAIGPSQLEETRSIAGWAVQRVVDLWAGGATSLTEADLRRFRGIGAARATDGRPLPAVLRAYRVAAVVTSDVVLELGGDSLDRDDLLALNRALLTGVDELSEAVFSGYASVTDAVARDRDEALRRLADDLLTGRHTSAAALADRSRELGITLPARFDLAVGAGVALADGHAEAPVGTGDALVLATTHAGRVVRLAATGSTTPDHRSSGTDRTPPYGCLIPAVGIADLPRAFRLASAAVAHAPADAAGRGLGEADALAVAMLRGAPEYAPQRFVRAALGDLLGPAERHLLEGLTAFLRHGSATEAAAALDLHPQTMRHRLRRVAQVTGRDPRDAWDRLVLHTAIAASTATS